MGRVIHPLLKIFCLMPRTCKQFPGSNLAPRDLWDMSKLTISNLLEMETHSR